jgi:hypothetical protein
MKDIIKLITTILGGIIGALIAIYTGYECLQALFSLVPHGDNAGLIKIAVGFVAFWLFGGLGVMLAIGLTLFFGWLGTLIGDMIGGK